MKSFDGNTVVVKHLRSEWPAEVALFAKVLRRRLIIFFNFWR